jgi:hypothetical protein
MVELSCWEVMGVPMTKAECKECGSTESCYGLNTYARAEKWSQEHVCTPTPTHEAPFELHRSD